MFCFMSSVYFAWWKSWNSDEMTNGKWKPLWSRMVAVMAMKYQRKTVNMCERTTSVPRYT